MIHWGKRLGRMISRVFHGENPLVVRQDRSVWEDQYRRGKWERLHDAQENTEWIAGRLARRNKGPDSLSSILDVGCGEGALLESIVRTGASVRYTGIDISATAIGRAKATLPSGNFLVMDVEHPTLDGRYDAIVFNEILYYVDATAALAAYRPFLNPGGSIVISMYRSWRTSLLWWAVRRALGKGEIHDLPKHRIGVYSPK